MSVRRRRYCFTANGVTASGLTDAQFADRLKEEENIEFFIFQREQGENPSPGNDGVHFQGYIRLKNPRRMRTLMGHEMWSGLSPHIEVIAKNATEQNNIDYCTKEDTRAEGHEPIQVCVAE